MAYFGHHPAAPPLPAWSVALRVAREVEKLTQADLATARR